MDSPPVPPGPPRPAGRAARPVTRGFWAPGPARWRRVMPVVGAVVLMALNVGYTNYVDHRTRGVFCAFLTASLPEAEPPITERGREVERRYLKLIRDLDC